jgi:hypothetical protein
LREGSSETPSWQSQFHQGRSSANLPLRGSISLSYARCDTCSCAQELEVVELQLAVLIAGGAFACIDAEPLGLRANVEAVAAAIVVHCGGADVNSAAARALEGLGASVVSRADLLDEAGGGAAREPARAPPTEGWNAWCIPRYLSPLCTHLQPGRERPDAARAPAAAGSRRAALARPRRWSSPSPPPLVLSGHAASLTSYLIGHAVSSLLLQVEHRAAAGYLTSAPVARARARAGSARARVLLAPLGARSEALAPADALATLAAGHTLLLVTGAGGAGGAGAGGGAVVSGAGPPPSLPYKVDTSRPPLRTNWTRGVPHPVPIGQARGPTLCAARRRFWTERWARSRGWRFRCTGAIGRRRRGATIRAGR